MITNTNSVGVVRDAVLKMSTIGIVEKIGTYPVVEKPMMVFLTIYMVSMSRKTWKQ
jgi:hypothetical protein